MPQASPKDAITRRLRHYWRIEAGNVVLVPLFAWGWVVWVGGAPTVSFGVAAFASSLLLVIGALYWRAVLRRAEGNARPFQFWIPVLAKLELPSLLLTAAAVIVAAGELAPLSRSGNRVHIATAGLAVLAVLEYVNYYRVQLQHFDHWNDWKRLLAGRGFRKAHLARDVAAWRAAQRSSVSSAAG